ncbi:NAD(P)H-dependent oxidoreductase [Oenococcus oeni]
MRITIIYSYPNKEGFNAGILKQVKNNLSTKHQVTIIDLYAENFDPVLHFDHLHQRRFLKDDPDLADYRQKITDSDLLIFIFPIWWSGMPAILKGFIDRTFSKGYAYSYKGLLPTGHLKGKKAWIITTNDTPSFYVHLVQKDYGKVLSKQVLKMCGIKTIKRSNAYYLRGSSLKRRQSFLRKIGLYSQRI